MALKEVTSTDGTSSGVIVSSSIANATMEMSYEPAACATRRNSHEPSPSSNALAVGPTRTDDFGSKTIETTRRVFRRRIAVHIAALDANETRVAGVPKQHHLSGIDTALVDFTFGGFALDVEQAFCLIRPFRGRQNHFNVAGDDTRVRAIVRSIAIIDDDALDGLSTPRSHPMVTSAPPLLMVFPP